MREHINKSKEMSFKAEMYRNLAQRMVRLFEIFKQVGECFCKIRELRLVENWHSSRVEAGAHHP